mgnify:CR=1 FL=1
MVEFDFVSMRHEYAVCKPLPAPLEHFSQTLLQSTRSLKRIGIL